MWVSVLLRCFGDRRFSRGGYLVVLSFWFVLLDVLVFVVGGLRVFGGWLGFFLGCFCVCVVIVGCLLLFTTY